jgi:hypothetical protein
LKLKCRREGGLACESRGYGRRFIKASCHGRGGLELRQAPEGRGGRYAEAGHERIRREVPEAADWGLGPGRGVGVPG